jgi:hypothetical protein
VAACVALFTLERKSYVLCDCFTINSKVIVSVLLICRSVFIVLFGAFKIASIILPYSHIYFIFCNEFIKNCHVECNG